MTCDVEGQTWRTMLAWSLIAAMGSHDLVNSGESETHSCCCKNGVDGFLVALQSFPAIKTDP